MYKILFFVLPMALAWALLSNSGGAAAVQGVDRTGSPLGSGSCGSCHGGGNYSPIISIELLDNNTVVSKYSPGQSYQVRVSISAINNPGGYGFQLVSLTGSSNVQGGTFGAAPSGFNKVNLNNRTYVEQSSTRSSGSFVIPWTAPAAGSGSVRFYSAGLAVNGTGGTGGDAHVQTSFPVTEAGDLATLAISSTSLNFPASGGTQNVNITSNTSWSASESISYLSVSPTSGTNNGTISINCDPNTSTVARSGSITVSGNGVANQTITFTQAGLPPILNVSPTSLLFENNGGTQTIAIESNMTWTLSESLSFVSLSVTTGSNSRTVEVICQPNTLAANRSGTIALSGTGVATKTISISQNAAAPALSVSPKELAFDQSGGNKTLSIASNTTWSVIESSSFVSLSQSTGTNSANITVTCQSNSSTGPRSGLIKIASPGLETQIINVSQVGAVPLLNVTPATMAFNAVGGTQRGTITANTNWTVQENVNFIRVDSPSGTNNGSINVICDANSSAISRTGVVTISAVGAASKTINISQIGASGFLTIAPVALNFTAAGGRQYFLVNSNTNWTVTEALAHITLNKTTGSFTDTVWVTCTPNTTMLVRAGLITVTGVGVPTKTLAVNQIGEQPVLSVSPSNLSFTSAAGTRSITITSNIPWTITSSGTYLSSNVTSGTNNATVTISCTDNPSALDRNTTLLIAGNGVSPVAIPVSQTGATARLLLWPLSLIFPANGGEKTFDVASNTSWSITDTFPHLSFSPLSGSNNGVVKVVCDTNITTSPRSFSVPVAGFGLTARTITITQSGADEIFKSSTNTIDFTSNGGAKTFSIFSNTSWALAESSSFISVNPSFGDLNKNITVLCAPNLSTTARKGKITFTGKSDASISIDVVQAGAVPLFKVLLDSIVLDSSAAQSSVKIESNTAWSLTKDVDWLSINTFSGSGNYSVLLSITENPVMQERIGRLQIKSAQTDSVKTVIVRQKGRKLQLPSNWQVKPTSLFHTIILPANLLSSIDGQSLSIGDFVGVFYKQQEKEMMAGYGAWTGSSTNFKVFGDDPSTPNIKEGLSVGEPFVIKIWSVKLKKEIMVRTDFATIGTQGLVISTDKFTNGGISMISKVTGTSTSLLTLLDENQVRIFPNPSNQLVQVQSNIAFLGQTFLEIYNANGQRIQQQNFPDGSPVGKNIPLDFSEHPQGIYQLRWYNNQFYWYGKVAIIR